MARHMARPVRKPLCALLALVVLLSTLTAWTFTAQAAETPTSLGLAEHGLMAYRDNWEYSYGGKGEYSEGYGENGNFVRYSDCAGLIYSYYKDLGAASGVYGGATSQVNHNCVFSGDIDELYGIPRIHGLVLTIPDYYDPATGVYSHIGIYVGNNMATDNSTWGTNMVYDQVVGSGRGWTAWHVFDAGTLYPSNGWYEFDGKLYHYTSCQYDVNTTVDGFTIGEDGVALGSNGEPLTPDSSEAPALSQEYVSAATVAGELSELGYCGKDTTQELVEQGQSDFNGKITGSGVRLRTEPNTSCEVVTILSQNTHVDILETVTGQLVEQNGQKSDQWYHVVTRQDEEGYVSALYAEFTNDLAAPTFSVENGSLVLSGPDGCEIHYTSDGTQPTAESPLYAEPLTSSGTYRAVASRDGETGPVATITFAGGSLFTDFTSSDWYFSYVDRAVDAGLFSGRGSEFDPTANITRGEFAAALANLAGVDTSAYKGTSSFSDVDSSQWYAGAVNWAAAKGIMSGMGDGTFGVNNSITREQICVAIANYAGLRYDGGAASFQDDSAIASWAKDAVYACRELGIISGLDDGTFAPKDSAQRCHACTMVLKAYDLGL